MRKMSNDKEPKIIISYSGKKPDKKVVDYCLNYIKKYNRARMKPIK